MQSMQSRFGFRWWQFILVTGLSAMCLLAHPVHAVEQWGVFETEFKAPPPAGSPMDVKFSATFTQGPQRFTVPGFWDGGDSFKLRFSPPDAGEWKFTTVSEIAALNGKSGNFTATNASGDNHGPIEVFKTFYLRYADGTPYHQYGTTCYAWVHQPRELEEQTLKTLAASPFNKIRFCVFPKSYTYNENEPDFFAFKKGADGKFDFSQPDPEFWRHFEQRILDLQELGVEADIILWHPYDRWGFSEMGREHDDRYLRYAIARLGAYRNVWWSLANEFDLMAPGAMAGHRGDKAMADWDRFFQILQNEDAHQRLRGIHNCRGFYDHTKDWVTHASVQTSDMNGGVRFREQFRKSVIYDECKYEGDVPQGWGNLTGREMTQRFWLGTMSGCYVGHGETYKHPDDILWWAKGGVLHGESPQRIQWLKDFMKAAPAFDELTVMGNDQGKFMLGKQGEYYLVYCLGGQTDTVKLSGDQAWKVDRIDPWEMTEWPEGTAIDGSYTVAALEHDSVYRFTQYAPGEALRPTAQPTASVSEGVPPLTVQFKSNSDQRVAWTFGDGMTSEQAAPTHVFEKPGVYPVTMTVTDANGGTARGNLMILVDHNSSDPILRVGFESNDSVNLKLHGTARRSDDGGFVFPAGEPWGRAEVEEESSEALGGLRSFTISGWLKPDELNVGAGGNRIFFSLQQSKAGIDLVHHADGGLRLAVNEWPDSVKNDSSPGRLVAGKWTYFVVTYDSTKHDQNVAWYFSAPAGQPTGQPTLKLDKRTSYNAGAVANRTGPIAVGNFNRTMQGNGYDRQFRGEIKGLQIFGSRISGRGALAQPDSIR